MNDMDYVSVLEIGDDAIIGMAGQVVNQCILEVNC